ncbi:MAG TPA: thioredoxin domain-containing protein [Sedimentisphaerales bacterium]|nr:thioredoxin domain-containing protein [Sedimentisphaerales bacterium]
MVERQAEEPHANRLIGQNSPYLLQHAHNPVNWFPWSDEAFEKARAEDKPVFLSIGYSTCHWCHVMERESFEDEQTARQLNQDFVSIKVDREERPDVDETYMKAVQTLTGTGGWPLSVFLTPQGKPFYGGTYFPPRAGFGRPSFRQVLAGVAQAWQTKREDLLASSQSLTEAIRRPSPVGPEQTLSGSLFRVAFQALSDNFDTVYGGFGSAPKFPQPTMLSLLLDYAWRTGERAALDMVDKSLVAMARGGIHDHLGGGFHRYSTDAQWLVPHFEKMLYDQATIGLAYIQAYQATGKAAHAAVARGIFDYVLRDMTDPGGGFYAGEDADSEGREGAFYVWREDEIQEILGEPDAEVFCDYYGVTGAGNFEQGENILHVVGSIEDTGAKLTDARLRLLTRRNSRPRPHRDDKIITSWNGLMISALAKGGSVLGEARYVQAATKAAAFVLESLRVDGRLMRYWRAGRVVEKAFLDDYAMLILGLIDLYEATFDSRWLAEARLGAEQMIDWFEDPAEGGFFLTGRDAERLISREKPAYDGVVPSGNSAAALGLLKLGAILMESRFSDQAERTLRLFSGPISQTPTAFTAMLLALDYRLGPSQEIVIAGPADQARPLIEEVRRRFLPNATLLLKETGLRGDALMEMIPFVRDLAPLDGRATAYVCEDHACRRPVVTTGDLAAILDGIGRNR